MDVGLDRIKNSPRPLIFRSDWPDTLALSEDTIRAAIFASVASKLDPGGYLVREDDRFLYFENLGDGLRLSSGDFVGAGSIIDSMIVRTDKVGNPVAPKRWFWQRMIAGSNGAECSWKETIDIALHFAGLKPLPPGFAWWTGEKRS